MGSHAGVALKLAALAASVLPISAFANAGSECPQSLGRPLGRSAWVVGEYLVGLSHADENAKISFVKNFRFAADSGLSIRPSGQETFVLSVPKIKAMSAGTGLRFGIALDEKSLQQTGNLESAIDEAIRAWAKDHEIGVNYVEPNYLFRLLETPNDTFFPQQSSLEIIGAPAAWNRTVGDAEIKVAIVDSGVFLQSPEMAGQLWAYPVDDRLVFGRNFVEKEYTSPSSQCLGFTGPIEEFPCDSVGHGTDVASVLGARANNEWGIAGVAWRTQLMALKFVDSQSFSCAGSDCGTLDAATRAIRYAVANGARIINLSWGGNACSDALYEAIKEARDATPVGILVVAAVDDQNRTRVDVAGKAFFPASFELENIIAVGGSTAGDEVDSDYGEHVLFAPDAGIMASTSDGSCQPKGGTSVAAPQVSGAAVLLWSLAPKWNYQQVKRYLFESADRPDKLARGGKTFARLNLDRATTAPIEFPKGLEGSRWTHGKAHSVTWNVRFDSAVCPEVDLALQADDENHQRAWFGLVPLKPEYVEIAPHFTFTGPRTVRLIATCPGTSLSSVSPQFTIL